MTVNGEYSVCIVTMDHWWSMLHVILN